MNGSRRIEDVVARLVDEAEPVRRSPAIRTQLFRVAVVWFATGLAVSLSSGLHPVDVVERSGISAIIAVVLIVAGFAGLTSGLAIRIPGRERLARTAEFGLLAALALVPIAWFLVSSSGARDPASPWGRCTGHSLLFSIPAGAVAFVLALRGAAFRATQTGVALSIGAVALGSLLVHASCPSPEPWHWLIEHLLGPAALALPIGLAAGALLGSRSRAANRNDQS